LYPALIRSKLIPVGAFLFSPLIAGVILGGANHKSLIEVLKIIGDSNMADHFQIFPVGIIKKKGNAVTIEIYEKYKDALLGLGQFSHIIVFFWFHQNDTPQKRDVLQVHPRGNKANPLTGVFATRSPIRPNLIAISTCKIMLINKNRIHIDKIDAFNRTPVIDIKPYIPESDIMKDVRKPEWVKKQD